MGRSEVEPVGLGRGLLKNGALEPANISPEHAQPLEYPERYVSSHAKIKPRRLDCILAFWL